MDIAVNEIPNYQSTLIHIPSATKRMPSTRTYKSLNNVPANVRKPPNLFQYKVATFATQINNGQSNSSFREQIRRQNDSSGKYL